MAVAYSWENMPKILNTYSLVNEMPEKGIMTENKEKINARKPRC
jgi:hypothetical protein